MEGTELNVFDNQNQLLLCNDLRVNTTENNSTEGEKKTFWNLNSLFSPTVVVILDRFIPL